MNKEVNLKEKMLELYVKFLLKKESRKQLEKLLLKGKSIEELVDKIYKMDGNLLSDLSLDVYKMPIDGYYNLYDYLLFKGYSFTVKQEDKLDNDILIPTLLRNERLPENIKTSQLLIQLPNGMKFIDYYFEEYHNLLDRYLNGYGFEINNIEVVKSFISHNKYEYLINADFSLYDEIIDGKRLLDIMIEHDIIPYNFTNNIFLKKTSNNITVLEEYLKMGKYVYIDLNTKNVDNELIQMVLILIKYSKFHQVSKASPELLCHKCSNGSDDTILDCFIKAIKKTDPTLIKDYLDNLEINEEVSLILAKYSYYYKPKKYMANTSMFGDDIVTEFLYSKDEVVEVNSEYDELVNEFLNVFQNSYYKSDKGILDLVIKSFYQALEVDSELAISELESLITLKKDYSMFRYIYNKDEGSAFRGYLNDDGALIDIFISLNNRFDTYVVNHENAHAIHYFCDNFKCPDEFNESDLISLKQDIIRSDIDADLDTSIAKRFFNNSKELFDNYDSFDYFVHFIKQRYGGITEFVNKTKVEYNDLHNSSKILLDAINAGCSNDILEALASIHYSNRENNMIDKLVEETVESRLGSLWLECVEKGCKKTYSAFFTYENFVDAFLKGQVADYLVAMMKKNEIYVPKSIHGSEYFNNDPDSRFQEMLADYVALKKSKDGQHYIKLIKKDISSDLIDLLDNYYRNIQSKKISKTQ